MIEHPVPQNVTSYEFHLVGNMTLKQFLELAAGVLIAIGIYGSNLYPIIKWPLVGLFVLAGVAFAFLPINERPLDAWFLAFIRAIYNPTKYFWKRNSLKPEVFSYQASTNLRSQATDIPARFLRRTPNHQTTQTPEFKRFYLCMIFIRTLRSP